jgi:hypothetical protein
MKDNLVQLIGTEGARLLREKRVEGRRAEEARTPDPINIVYKFGWNPFCLQTQTLFRSQRLRPIQEFSNFYRNP